MVTDSTHWPEQTPEADLLDQHTPIDPFELTDDGDRISAGAAAGGQATEADVLDQCRDLSVGLYAESEGPSPSPRCWPSAINAGVPCTPAAPEPVEQLAPAQHITELPPDKSESLWGGWWAWSPPSCLPRWIRRWRRRIGGLPWRVLDASRFEGLVVQQPAARSGCSPTATRGGLHFMSPTRRRQTRNGREMKGRPTRPAAPTTPPAPNHRTTRDSGHRLPQKSPTVCERLAANGCSFFRG